MKQNYRETKNDLIHCPFNPNHLVKRSRLITHKKLCPDKNSRGIVQCPYNPSHHVLIENLDKHKEKCPDRVVINSDLASEMEAYIKGLKTGERKKDKPNPTPTPIVEKGKENDKNQGNEIVGLEQNKKNVKNKKNKKQEKVEEKLIDLENLSNKELFNCMFEDKICIEYDSDSSENGDDDQEQDENENDDSNRMNHVRD